ncbi:hypothetical protein TDMWS_06840 [Thermodesulfomicrobium sp. WS]|uniref:hypothetical protein n=1 Tax=Thermodesulfomicrobium sp. WS TaxID=3004129 RepID=UPI00249024FF|nr:hypothetical protein [Thermodesulfomicrobium sp. WS]BDV00599.1 hypothetical protein TDMWS_06840 [Thermodesulfomicrobium sp. WS]
MEFRGLARLPLCAFPAGTLGARRFRRVRLFFAALHAWLRLVGRLSAAAVAEHPVDWAVVEQDVERLAAATMRSVRLLQALEPTRWLDVEEWAVKLTFYARLMAGHPEPEISPSFFSPLVPGRGMVVENHLWRYAMDVADLQRRVDGILRRLSAVEDPGWQRAARLVQDMPLPEVVEREAEILAFEWQARTCAAVAVLEAPEGQRVLEPVLVPVRELWAGVRRAWALRFAPDAVAWRRFLGRCDEEVGCRVVVVADPKAVAWEGTVQGLMGGAPPEDAAAPGPGVWILQEGGTWVPVASPSRAAAGAPWRQRLETVRTRIVGEGDPPVRPEHCRNLEDMIALALTACWDAVFSRLGSPGPGVAGVKSLALDPLGEVRFYCTPGAVFPSAAGKSLVGAEDVRSLPLWSLLNGWIALADPVVRASSARAVVGYGIVGADAMHLCLFSGRHILFVEGEALTSAQRQVVVRWKVPWALQEELGVVAQVLAERGFTVTRQGMVLDAWIGQGSEVVMQRALAVFGGVVRGVLGGQGAGVWRRIVASWGRG